MQGNPQQKTDISSREATVCVACLAVEAVVDVVDDVLRAGLEEDEPGFVLLRRLQLLPGELRLRVHVLLRPRRSVKMISGPNENSPEASISVYDLAAYSEDGVFVETTY